MRRTVRAAAAALTALMGTAVGQTISAHAKGPDQINLTWKAAADPGYGYLVEIQSAEDARYRTWTELQPIATAGGYTCDPTVISRGARCNTSDPAGLHVYNPPNHGIPYWVTDATYIDPQDDSAAQFIAWGLKPNTGYSFRVRTYSGQTLGAYSKVITAKTADYPARYVSPAGKDANDGKSPDAAHAWRTLAHASANLACGQVLIVAGGTYASDAIGMGQRCTQEAKAVVLVNPGETASMTTLPPNTGHAVAISGQHIVIDGLTVVASGVPDGEYDIEITGNWNALLNVENHPPVVPSFHFGVTVLGAHNLVYRSYLHDSGSPDPGQNPDGGGGFVLAVLNGAARHNVIWSNHLTRGGHDESLCKGGCSENRWLNNVMDGGWGQGWIAVAGPGRSDHNLVEGNVIKNVGQLVPYFKPAIQVSGAYNTVRRNVVMGTHTWALEVSSFTWGTASYNLIHNNVFYHSGGCYFQSSSRGWRAYFHVIYANNICYGIQNLATQIYLANGTNRIAANNILALDTAGNPLPDKPLVIWNQLGGGIYEAPKSIATADRTYDPPFSRNRDLTVAPQFVDEAGSDFHLSAASPLIGAGIPIANTSWGSSKGAVDLGAFGLNVAPEAVWPSGLAMERGRAGDYEAAVKGLRGISGLPHAQALESALLRAAEAGERPPMTHTPDPGDLMARYERVREGGDDAALWEALTAAPDRALEIADLYLQWGLTRDAMVLLTHRGPHGAPSPDDALFFYYRSYCRDRLDYEYYATEDLKAAPTHALKDVPARLGASRAVLLSSIQRNPVDAQAHYLVATLNRSLGRVDEAREEVETAVQLRPGFPEAEALLAKLPPGKPPVKRTAPLAPRPSTTTSPAVSAGPREIAAMALKIAASGDIRGAMSYFTPANFPKEKQEDAVREAYIELRARRLVQMAETRQCSGADQGITNLEAEEKSLPFTFNGFGAFTKGARFQYLLGLVEYTCVDEKAGRKRWEKVAKADAPIGSTDYPYPYLAFAKLDPEAGRARAGTALGFVERQIPNAAPARIGALQFSRGLLQSLLGKNAEAMSSFRAGAEAGPPGMVEYLNLEAIRELDAVK